MKAVIFVTAQHGKGSDVIYHAGSTVNPVLQKHERHENYYYYYYYY